MNIRLNPNEVREIPKKFGFGFCVYGDLDISKDPKAMSIIEWVNYWGFRTEKSGVYTNIIIPKSFDLSECFSTTRLPFKYMDGFSPNLNKNLHVGHFSNMIIAKCFQSMGFAEESVAILGDTLEGDVLKADALREFKTLCKMFGYNVNYTYFASEVKLTDELEKKLLSDGKGEYKGTKVFDLGSQKMVGKKSDGSTTYFYQDIAFANVLCDRTMYLTGNEQKGHFELVNKLSPKEMKHFGLGLVTVEGKKMSSRDGNVIYLKDVLSELREKFNDNKLSYNVMAGQILKSEPHKTKSVNMDTITNVKSSSGLYLSYTAARLKSAGVEFEKTEKFHSNFLQYKYSKASWNYSPNILLDGLIEHCKQINRLYENKDYNIREDDNVRVFFGTLLEDLELGMKKLGMFSIEEVKNDSINELNEQTV